MFRRWHLLFITFLLALVVLDKVNAYYDDDDDDYDDNDYKDDHYDEHYQGDGCSEDFEDPEDPEDLEEIAKLLIQKGMALNGISPMTGQGLIVPSDTCTTTWFSNQVYKHFNAIIFGDFEGIGYMSGPLAVKGKFTSLSYSVNVYGTPRASCSLHDPNSVDSYAFVVGGITDSTIINVVGDAYVNGQSSETSIFEDVSECSVKDQEGTGLVDFDALEVEVNLYNNLYRDHPPTLQLNDDGSLKRLTDSDGDLEYLTFNSCNDKPSCEKIWEGQMSAAENILLGEGDWNGIQGDIKPDSSKTYVFNIPVIENTNIYILTTSQPSLGFNGCKLVYNFYPVKQGTGEYNPTGVFTLVRNNIGYFTGLVLAPRGNIIDDTNGNFAAQIFALSYFVQNPKQVPVYNFIDVSKCNYFNGCDPRVPPPPPPSCNATETTVTAKTTVTQGSITTVTQDITVTEGSETITQLSTVTSSGDVTQTVTSLVTETVYHTHNEDCDEEEEEYYKDSYEKKWNHKEHDDEDDCDQDHYY